MKRIILILLILVIGGVFPSIGQVSKLSVGIKSGINQTRLIRGTIGNEIAGHESSGSHDQWVENLTYGIKGRYQVSNSVSLSTGLLIDNRSTYHEYPSFQEPSINFEKTETRRYLSIPLLLEYYIKGNNLFYLEFGLHTSFLSSYNVEHGEFNPPETYDITPNNYIYGLVGGTGVKVPILEKLTLDVNARATQTLKSASTLYLQTLSLNVGLVYNL